MDLWSGRLEEGEIEELTAPDLWRCMWKRVLDHVV
jgi:hypothetical protein